MGLVEGGMAGAIARIDGIYPAPVSPARPRLHVGMAERRRQAVQYAVSQDAPRYHVVSWADFRVSLVAIQCLGGGKSLWASHRICCGYVRGKWMEGHTYGASPSACGWRAACGRASYQRPGRDSRHFSSHKCATPKFGDRTRAD